MVELTASGVLALDRTENSELKVDEGGIVLLEVAGILEDGVVSILVMVVNEGNEVEIVWVASELVKTGVEVVWLLLSLETNEVCAVLCRVLIEIDDEELMVFVGVSLWVDVDESMLLTTVGDDPCVCWDVDKKFIVFIVIADVELLSMIPRFVFEIETIGEKVAE